jgi:RNA polymerase sigma factor (sigma-70 family)
VDTMDTSVGQLRLVQSGDVLAWSKFSEHCRAVILRWCRWQGICTDDADDIVQESLLIVLTKVGRFQHAGRGTLRAWLKAIARRCWLATLVQREDSRLRELGVLYSESNDEIARLEAEFDEILRMNLLDQAMHQVRGRVHEATWEAFVQTAIQGQSAEAVGAVLNLSVGAVYSARARVQRMISTDFRRLYANSDLAPPRLPRG